MAERVDESEAASGLAEAERKLAAGRTPDALATAAAAVEGRDVTLVELDRLVRLLVKAGETAQAHQLMERLIASLEAAHADRPDEDFIPRKIAEYLFRMQRFAEAEPWLAPLAARAALDQTGTLMLCQARLESGDGPSALAAWQPLFDAHPENGRLRLLAAKMFAHFGHRDRAEHCLALAEPLCADIPQKVEQTAAVIRGRAPDDGQLDQALGVFDEVAAQYDRNMDRIGNAGPDAVAEMLRRLDLPAEARLDILDAGCGTGLCGGLLRPYARRLEGCDASVPMLHECRAKNVYDTLTRTDLGRAETYPEGQFDVVVCSDVLVYFGALEDVLATLTDRLGFGGWLLVTVERAEPADAPEGYSVTASARYKHTAAYLRQTLVGVGLEAPALEIEGVLRHEYFTPVPGLAVAARKPGGASDPDAG